MKLSLDHGTYVKSIGFIRKDGKRVQKRWWLGTSEPEAILQAAQLQKAWKEGANTADHPEGQVWRDDFKIEQAAETPDDTRDRLEKTGKTLPFSEGADDVTTKEALEWFYAEKESRMKLRGSSNIKQSSVTRLRYNTSACLLPFPHMNLLSHFNAENLKLIHNYWMGTDHAGRPGARLDTIGERTAVNYLNDLKCFLRACGTNSQLGYDLPKELGAWKFPKKAGQVFIPTLDELGILYKAASARMKCFLLIALNAGQLQNDIGRMTPDDVVVDNGHSVIRKVRLKTEKTVTFKGCWQLWPETLKAINANREKSGDLLFANKDGKPLYEQKAKSKSDAIGDEFAKLRNSLVKEGKKIRQDVTFSTIRAFGASFVATAAASDYFAKLYLCHSVSTGATRSYIDAQYAPLQPYLKQMRKALKWL